MTDATMPPLGHPEPHTMKWTALEIDAIHDYARAYAAQCLAAVAEDAERYQWIKANAEVTFREPQWFTTASGNRIHSIYAISPELDAAIDNARGKK